MVTTIVYVHVKPNHINDFIEATIKNHEKSVTEDGNLRFDVLQDDGDPCRFVLYEAYVSKDHAAMHKETTHYLNWRETVAPYMAEQRAGVHYKGIRPQSE